MILNNLLSGAGFVGDLIDGSGSIAPDSSPEVIGAAVVVPGYAAPEIVDDRIPTPVSMWDPGVSDGLAAAPVGMWDPGPSDGLAPTTVSIWDPGSAVDEGTVPTPVTMSDPRSNGDLVPTTVTMWDHGSSDHVSGVVPTTIITDLGGVLIGAAETGDFSFSQVACTSPATMSDPGSNGDLVPTTVTMWDPGSSDHVSGVVPTTIITDLGGVLIGAAETGDFSFSQVACTSPATMSDPGSNGDLVPTTVTMWDPGSSDHVSGQVPTTIITDAGGVLIPVVEAGDYSFSQVDHTWLL